MSSYSELIKNFERIRAYMREFYIYGFFSYYISRTIYYVRNNTNIFKIKKSR